MQGGRFGGSGGGPGGPGGGRFAHAPQKAKNSQKTLARMYGYLSYQRRLFIAIICMVVCGTFVTLASPALIKTVIDQYIAPRQFAGLPSLLIAMAALYLTGAGITWLQAWSLATLSQRTVHRLRTELFSKVQTLPVSFFDKRPYGELMSRLTNDVDNINMALSQSLTSLMTSILSVIGSLAMMIYYSPLLSLAACVTIPISLGVTTVIAKRTRLYYREQQSALGDLNGFIEESVTGQRVVQVFSREPEMEETFSRHNQRHRKAAVTANILTGLIGPLMNVLNNLSFAVVALAGGAFVLMNWISIGTIAAFTQYSRQFTRPLNDIANQFNSIQSAVAGAERVFEILDEQSETDSPGSVVLENTKGDVSFKNVDFGYAPDVKVLKDITLNARPGQTIALVGPTGAGKTTVVNLLMRFYEVDAGTIAIDGIDIRGIQKNSLRQKLGIVLQDVHLFAGSVRENIRYGRLDAPDAEGEAAARTADAESFILRMPYGYDTVLTEEGTNLSHGQRQLLSIARAVLADPAILILDEATSSVDTRTEIVIQKAMLELMKGRTSFVIAHRLSTIREADAILVIDDGRIIERGTHEELLVQKGFYEQLYMSQFRRQEIIRREAQDILSAAG